MLCNGAAAYDVSDFPYIEKEEELVAILGIDDMDKHTFSIAEMPKIYEPEGERAVIPLKYIVETKGEKYSFFEDGGGIICVSSKYLTPFDDEQLYYVSADRKVIKAGGFITEGYGEIKRDFSGKLYTTKAQRTGCSMCGFGIQLEKRPHRFDRLREHNPKEWEFWMYRCCKDEQGKPFGWGKVLDYIGVGWEDEVFDWKNNQLTFMDMEED